MKKYQKGDALHHIIPRVFYKYFTEPNGRIWYSKVSTDKIKISFKQSVKGINYGYDFYKISPKTPMKYLNIKDQYVVENRINQKFEDNFENIFDPIRSKNRIINIGTKSSIAETIIHFKSRGVFAREKVFNNKQQILDILYKEALNLFDYPDQETVEMAAASNLTVSEYITRSYEMMVQDVFMNDSGVFHNQFLIQQNEDPSPLHIEAINIIVLGQWNILESTAPSYFITNDNPWFTVQNGKISNMLMEGKFILLFPISSYQTLVIECDSNVSSNSQISNLNSYAATNDEVDLINLYTCRNALNEVYGNDKGVLEETVYRFDELRKPK